MKLIPLLPVGKIEPHKSLSESSRPLADASYVGSFASHGGTHYDLFKFRVGNYKVFVAALPNGDVANDGKMPWFWPSERDAAKQIAKWR